METNGSLVAPQEQNYKTDTVLVLVAQSNYNVLCNDNETKDPSHIHLSALF